MNEKNEEILLENGQNPSADLEHSAPVQSVGSPTDSSVNEVVVVEPYAPDGTTFAAYGITYGNISSTYLDYFAGIVEKVKSDEHYVVWKSGDNSYSIAWGKSMEGFPDLISGYDLECVRIYRDRTGQYDGWKTMKETVQNLELRTNEMFVYSDLNYYPTLKRGVSSYETLSVTFALCVGVLLCLCTNIFKSIRR